MSTETIVSEVVNKSYVAGFEACVDAIEKMAKAGISTTEIIDVLKKIKP